MSVHAPDDSSQPSKPAKGLPRTFVALCIAIGALIGAYCVLILVSLAMASTAHRTRTFAVTARQLQIETGAADVQVVGERRRDMRVDMEIHRGMFRNGFQPRVALRQEGHQLQLGSHCSLMAHVGVGDCGASFTVYVPRGTTVAVRAGSGDVHVENATSALRVTASSGDVHVAGYRGRRLAVKTGSGDVHVSALRAPHRLRVDAGSGDVDVAVPNAVYSVLVDTGSGDRDVTVRQNPAAPRTIQVSTSSGDASVAPLGDAD
jgi:Putative adhesin